MSPDPDDSTDGDRYSFTYTAGEINQPTVAVVEAVSWVKGVEPSALDPLGEAIDPEALNELFGERTGRQVFTRSGGESTPDDLEVVFEFADCLVTVDAHRIAVDPR